MRLVAHNNGALDLVPVDGRLRVHAREGDEGTRWICLHLVLAAEVTVGIVMVPGRCRLFQDSCSNVLDLLDISTFMDIARLWEWNTRVRGCGSAVQLNGSCRLDVH